jgi:hypothetical protein
MRKKIPPSTDRFIRIAKFTIHFSALMGKAFAEANLQVLNRFDSLIRHNCVS